MAGLLELIALACSVAYATSSTCVNGSCQQLYTLLSLDSAIASAHVSHQMAASSATHCAKYCTSRVACLSYAVRPSTSDVVVCDVSPELTPSTSTQTGARVYAVSRQERVASVDCTDPPLDTSRLYTCNGAPTFEAAAMLRMGSSRAILFTSSNEYVKCSSMNNIVEQGAEYCSSKRAVLGDANIDPLGDRFASGPPDGAVGYIRSNMVECRYYLFKDDLVYCYQHTDNEPWLTPCAAWTSSTIQARFGDGLPSNVDGVFGNFDYSYDFYFVKGNLVYLSTGNDTSGRLAAGYPKHVHDVVPAMLCNITGVQLGLNNGEYYYTRGKNIYKQENGIVYYKQYLCN